MKPVVYKITTDLEQEHYILCMTAFQALEIFLMEDGRKFEEITTDTMGGKFAWEWDVQLMTNSDLRRTIMIDPKNGNGIQMISYVQRMILNNIFPMYVAISG